MSVLLSALLRRQTSVTGSICEVVNGRRSITADTALRLARYFAMTPQFWMNLQAAYDLDLATRASADRIKRDVHPRAAA
jgi:antitoxin HigA-1